MTRQSPSPVPGKPLVNTGPTLQNHRAFIDYFLCALNAFSRCIISFNSYSTVCEVGGDVSFIQMRTPGIREVKGVL